MRKLTVPLLSAIAASLLTALLMSVASNPFTVSAQTRNATSYGDDRAAIEDLQAR